MCDCQYFDLKNCDFCCDQARIFDEFIHYEKTFIEKKQLDEIKDIRIEKLYQWRQCDRWRSAKEAKWARVAWQKKFRTKFKRNILDEEYYNPVRHEYLTYGWVTW
ncbi:hypothetical protein D3C87_78290 [compost metagenome]